MNGRHYLNLNRKIRKYDIYKSRRNKKLTNIICSGSLEDLQSIYAWRDELERKTLKMEDRMLDVLEGNWLRGGKKKKERKKKKHAYDKLISNIYNSLNRKRPCF